MLHGLFVLSRTDRTIEGCYQAESQFRGKIFVVSADVELPQPSGQSGTYDQECSVRIRRRQTLCLTRPGDRGQRCIMVSRHQVGTNQSSHKFSGRQREMPKASSEPWRGSHILLSDAPHHCVEREWPRKAIPNEVDSLRGFHMAGCLSVCEGSAPY
jgi:hypothetical protein